MEHRTGSGQHRAVRVESTASSHSITISAISGIAREVKLARGRVRNKEDFSFSSVKWAGFLETHASTPCSLNGRCVVPITAGENAKKNLSEVVPVCTWSWYWFSNRS